MDTERRAEYEQFTKIDAAFRGGDLRALRAALGDPEDFPNCPTPVTIGLCLEYAIYHSPIRFICELLEAGANPNPENHTGFPPLIAALSCATAAPGHPRRSDVHELLELLLSFHADPNQRGLNDYTPLHWAAGSGDARAVEILLAHGADAMARTRIDDYETPREVAEKAGRWDIVEVLDRS